MDPRSVASPGLVSAFMQKKCHDLLRDHDQMGKHDCYWRAKVRKTTWAPRQDSKLATHHLTAARAPERTSRQSGGLTPVKLPGASLFEYVPPWLRSLGCP